MADNIGRDKLASLVSDSSGCFLFHESIENMILRMFRDITNTALKVKSVICHNYYMPLHSHSPHVLSARIPLSNNKNLCIKQMKVHIIICLEIFVFLEGPKSMSTAYASGFKWVLGHARNTLDMQDLGPNI